MRTRSRPLPQRRRRRLRRSREHPSRARRLRLPSLLRRTSRSPRLSRPRSPCVKRLPRSRLTRRQQLSPGHLRRSRLPQSLVPPRSRLRPLRRDPSVPRQAVPAPDLALRVRVTTRSARTRAWAVSVLLATVVVAAVRVAHRARVTTRSLPARACPVPVVAVARAAPAAHRVPVAPVRRLQAVPVRPAPVARVPRVAAQAVPTRA